MQNDFMSEAFRKLDLLNEDTFSIDKEGVEELDDFVEESEEDDSIDIIDPDAEDEEEIKETYVGKVILDCPVCHSKIYEDKEKVEIDEDTDMANPDMECPYCFATGGYEIVGEVKEFDKDDHEDHIDDEEEADVEIEEKEEVKEESLKEGCGKDSPKGKKMKEFLDADVDVALDASGQSVGIAGGTGATGGFKSVHECDEEECEEVEEDLGIGAGLALAGAGVGAGILGSKLLGKNEAKESKRDRMLHGRKEVTEEKQCAVPRTFKKDELKESPIYGLETQYDSRKSFGGKAQVETDNKGNQTLYSYNTPVVKISGDKVALLPRWDESATPLRHVKEFLKQNGFAADSKESIRKMYGESLKEAEEVGRDLAQFQKWVDYDMKRYGKISDITKRKLDKAGLEVVKDDHDDYEVIAKEDNGKPIKEQFEKVEIETKDEVIKVEAEKKDEHEETITPVSKETEEEILGDEDGFEVDEVSEEEVDELGEAYLKEAYANVKSFKTVQVRGSKNGFILEGMITFDSGKKKKTAFKFEAKAPVRNGKVRLLGENLQITPKKNAFVLSGKMEGKKFVSESLNYRYSAKDGGKAVRLYGTKRVGK